MQTKIILSEQSQRYVHLARAFQNSGTLSPFRLNHLSTRFYDSLPQPLQKQYSEILTVFDPQKNCLGPANWLLVRSAGLLHYGTFVLLTHQNRFLLQERNTATAKGCWCFTGGGGFDAWPPQKPLTAQLVQKAFTELSEECFSLPEIPNWMESWIPRKPLIIELLDSRPDEFGFHHAWNAVFLIELDKPRVYDWEKYFCPNPREVLGVKWFSWKEVKALAQIGRLSHEFSQYVKRYLPVSTD